jgi:hypothetical protein
MVALNDRLPDAYKLLPPAGHPGPGEGRRRSLREVVADRRVARAAQHAGPASSGLAEWLADRQRQADLHAERARPGAVGERRVAEALRARATDPDPAAGRQGHDESPAERERDRQDQERDRGPEDDFSDSWRSYRERADQIRRTHGWRVPEPPLRAEPWLPLGHTTARSTTATARTANLRCSRSSQAPARAEACCCSGESRTDRNAPLPAGTSAGLPACSVVSSLQCPGLAACSMSSTSRWRSPGQGRRAVQAGRAGRLDGGGRASASG